ncbi:hypothetical protein Lfu02_55180 [Longispora fulva]|uniref:Uncharacterized protein n=1 Tax=Longispora fulva TaxID=619741 RepID=A0A8J7GGI5_9ACTN|nr:hypothetical protein [Longispora fulva]MBG6137501.1 hypothetical protein [Longispora fulva]GIG61146.1 hypothetical protein Lfu02_55180 [Longispora fulva]
MEGREVRRDDSGQRLHTFNVGDRVVYLGTIPGGNGLGNPGVILRKLEPLGPDDEGYEIGSTNIVGTFAGHTMKTSTVHGNQLRDSADRTARDWMGKAWEALEGLAAERYGADWRTAKR